MAVSRATGVRRRMITTSSPASAAAMSRDSRARAC